MAGGELDWASESRDGGRVVTPRGRVDEATASAFSERLISEAVGGAGVLVIDLSGIQYMSSRGLRALTLAQRKGAETGTTITLARPNPIMREILAISRYDMVFRVSDTIEGAFAG
jgi:anti-sigma B factor antagonist